MKTDKIIDWEERAKRTENRATRLFEHYFDTIMHAVKVDFGVDALEGERENTMKWFSDEMHRLLEIDSDDVEIVNFAKFSDYHCGEKKRRIFMGSEKEIEYPMDQAKEMLSNIPELRFYKNYIKTRLAGDFAFDIAEYIENLQSVIERNEG